VEISVFTGLPVSEINSILTKHYLNRDPKIADSAGEKLQKLAEQGTKLPTDPFVPQSRTEKSE
jgi:hypothetical protein